MLNFLHTKLWHIFQLLDSISILLNCEIEDMDDRPNKHHNTMLDFEKMIQNDMVTIKTFLGYKKFISKSGCKCHYCEKIGFQDLKNMCEKGLSSIYMTYENIIDHEKGLNNNENSDKVFLHRLKLQLFKLIHNIRKMKNYVSSDMVEIPDHIVKKPWKTILKKYY